MMVRADVSPHGKTQLHFIEHDTMITVRCYIEHIIRLATKFLRYFFKCSKTFEKFLEVSILRVYKGSVNTFRVIVKSSIWTLIMN